VVFRGSAPRRDGWSRRVDRGRQPEIERRLALLVSPSSPSSTHAPAADAGRAYFVDVGPLQHHRRRAQPPAAPGLRSTTTFAPTASFVCVGTMRHVTPAGMAIVLRAALVRDCVARSPPSYDGAVGHP